MGYYHKTQLEWAVHHWPLTDSNHVFSPKFIYNQVNGGQNEGDYFTDCGALICEQGCGTMAEIPEDSDYVSWPSESVYSHAIPFRSESCYYFSVRDMAGINELRQRLDSGYTSVLGTAIYGNFYILTDSEYDTNYCVKDTFTDSGGDGSHGLCIVGYDDNRITHDGTGAFRLVNSWGTAFGDRGYFWMSYQAVMDSQVSWGQAFYLTERIGYKPTLLGRVCINHYARDRINFW
jgi:C1A family cysteine protease